jgi:hypothetical protein
MQLDFPADDVETPAIHGEERSRIEKAALAAIHEQGQVKDVYRGRFDLVIELVMNDGVHLADVSVDANSLVRTSHSNHATSHKTYTARSLGSRSGTHD